MPDEFTQLGMASGGDLPALRGVVEALVAHVAPDAALSVTPQEAPGFVAGASAAIVIDGQPAGQIGLAAQAVLDYYGLEKPHALATLRFDALMARAGRTKMFKPLSKFPAVRRDLSVVVDEATAWRQIGDAVRSANQPELVDVEYVGVYRGKQVSAGKKSVTLTLTYRNEAGTLRGEQVDQNVSAVVAALEARLGAQLRA
jgi:phenylalanyl-tRNA synthetase beta chain